MDFLYRGDSKEASMGDIVVVWKVHWRVRMLKRIASFSLVNVCPSYRLDDIILSAEEGG